MPFETLALPALQRASTLTAGLVLKGCIQHHILLMQCQILPQHAPSITRVTLSDAFPSVMTLQEIKRNNFHLTLMFPPLTLPCIYPLSFRTTAVMDEVVAVKGDRTFENTVRKTLLCHHPFTPHFAPLHLILVHQVHIRQQ